MLTLTVHFVKHSPGTITNFTQHGVLFVHFAYLHFTTAIDNRNDIFQRHSFLTANRNYFNVTQPIVYTLQFHVSVRRLVYSEMLEKNNHHKRSNKKVILYTLLLLLFKFYIVIKHQG
jgi:hypothetical protein